VLREGTLPSLTRAPADRCVQSASHLARARCPPKWAGTAL